MAFDFINVCRNLINIDSSPQGGTSEIVGYIAKLCKDLDLYVDIQKERKKDLDQANIIVRLDPNQADKEFLLLSHLDTVDPGNYRMWKETGQNPFNGTIIQNNIYGLGAVDAKLDFACKLRALLEVREKRKGQFKLFPVLVGTYGQELGLLGASKLLRKGKVSPVKVLVGDPSNLRLCCAGKGMATVEIRIPFSEEEICYRRDHDTLESTSSQSKIFSGRAAHSSSPYAGNNAINKMFSYLEKMPEGLVVMEMEGGVSPQTIPASAVLEMDIVGGVRDNITSRILKIYKRIRQIEEEFGEFPDKRFSPSKTILNFGVVRTYEDYILLCGVCLVTPSVDNETYGCWMNRIDESCRDAGGVLRIKSYKKPFNISEDSDFVQGCLEEMGKMGLDPEVSFNASYSEASIFDKNGIDCISFGPGLKAGNSHSANEHVNIEDLNKATEFYRRALTRFCF